jgi:hypothetical protein
MATFLRCRCLFLTWWMAGSRRPAIARTVDSDPCVMYTGSTQNQTQRGATSRQRKVFVRTGDRARGAFALALFQSDCQTAFRARA